MRDIKKFEAKKNKIEGNQVITHPDSLPTKSKEGEEQFQGGLDIKSFNNGFKYNFNSTTEDDDISEDDAVNFIKPHTKHLMTFESFSKSFGKKIRESSESIDPESDTEPGYEPEWCEDCSSDSEENGIEYTPDFTWKNDSWVCDHCGGYC